MCVKLITSNIRMCAEAKMRGASGSDGTVWKGNLIKVAREKKDIKREREKKKGKFALPCGWNSFQSMPVQIKQAKKVSWNSNSTYVYPATNWKVAKVYIGQAVGTAWQRYWRPVRYTWRQCGVDEILVHNTPRQRRTLRIDTSRWIVQQLNCANIDQSSTKQK